MQLVDQGKLDLDHPIRTWLPEFSSADPTAVETITVRHLLTHTAGLEDTSLSTDPKVTATLAAFLANTLNPPRCFAPPGTIHSYANAGFAIAGRLIEVLAERDWMTLLMERICAPLGLSTAFVDPAHAKRHDAAVGHMPGPNGEGDVVAPDDSPVCMAPAGSTLAMSATDLLRFVAGQGEILSASSIEAMQTPQVALHDYSPRGVTHWGLGWSLVDHPRCSILSHEGATPGQAAYLRVAPKAGFAIALLTNSHSIGLWDELFPELLRALTGIELPGRPPASDITVDEARYVGAYGDGVTVTFESGLLHVALVDGASGATLLEADLHPFAPDAFELRSPMFPGLGEARFLGSDDHGRARYLSWGYRALPRRADVADG